MIDSLVKPWRKRATGGVEGKWYGNCFEAGISLVGGFPGDPSYDALSSVMEKSKI